MPGAVAPGAVVPGAVAHRASGTSGSAARLLADAERIARSTPEDLTRTRALSDVAKALTASDPDKAARLFAEAERIAQSITDERWKVHALAAVAAAQS